MRLDSLVNRGDYFSAHYLAEVLPKDLKKKDGLLARWAEEEKQHRQAESDDSNPKRATPRQGLRALGKPYFADRPFFADLDARRRDGEPLTANDAAEQRKKLHELHGDVLRALGFDAQPRELSVERAGREHTVSIAYADDHLIAIECGWAVDVDAALDDDQAGKLLDPVQLDNTAQIRSASKLAKWLFADDTPPRYVLILAGGVVILADRATWSEARYLGVSLDIALGRNDIDELSVIAALFGADSLLPPAEGGSEPLADLLNSSRNHAVGVSKELRDGLKESVELIANEVLDRIRAQGARPEDIMEPAALAKELGRESLRYLYRILFLLYAEARPELGILPTDDQDYSKGYSLARLGDLVVRDLGSEESRNSLHLYESLDLLFRLVNTGHRPRTGHEISEDEGLRFEPMRSDLFEPGAIGLIRKDLPLDDDEDRTIDTRLRNACLYQVLRKLMLAKGRRKERGGFISYAQLGINQLGAVYEGLMSYTGFIATEDLLEVAKNGDSKDGSWMIPASKETEYPAEVFVRRAGDDGTKAEEYMRYPQGSFVYRLAGRDRETSASYYTPESLTSVTVQLALKYRLDQDGTTTTAHEILDWKICEPALGSGAFLNEAINQVAAEYLKRRMRELGTEIDSEQYDQELQKAKAYIALHNSYGVDLNETAVELAEVSLWLNVMHPGLQAPWFGLHLRRGNSLIGAGRKVYTAAQLAKGEWLGQAPEDLPLSAGALPSGRIHHFLVPADGWGAVAGAKEAKALAPEQAKQLADWRKGIKKRVSEKKTNGRKLSQVQRLQVLSGRVEYLWHLVIQRLTISEQEISRKIDVWGADWLTQPAGAVPKEKVYQDLTAPGTPYWRLKKVMDAWCALWFWPLDKVGLLDGTADAYAGVSEASSIWDSLVSEAAPVEQQTTMESTGFEQVYVTESLFSLGDEQLDLAGFAHQQVSTSQKRQSVRRPKLEPVRAIIPLQTLDDWLDFAEAVLGRADVPEDSLVSSFESLNDLEEYEDQLPAWMGMDSEFKLGERFPWFWDAENLAEYHGFFHWDLQFAHIFVRAGFDLQVGNPPWVRPRWEEASILAELEPWFQLAENPAVPAWNARRSEVLGKGEGRAYLLGELASNAGVVSILGSVATYELLSGTQPNLYRAFMVRSWLNLGSNGISALIHPDSHFTGAQEGKLREAAYRHLRLHAHFQNQRLLFSDVDWSRQYGVQVYGSAKDIGFTHVSWLFDPVPLMGSFEDDGMVEDRPGIKHNGYWDLRPHRDRLVWVDEEVLAGWQLLLGESDMPVAQTKLIYPVTTAEQGAIAAFARVGRRLGDQDPRISSGYHENTAKRDHIIVWETFRPTDWSEVILRGPQFTAATPFAKQPPKTGRNDMPVDLTTLAIDAVPTSDYRRAADLSVYSKVQDQWGWDGIEPRRYTDFYRICWREMIPNNTTVSLFAAIIPPGPAHIHGVRSMALPSNRETVLVAGFWASLPLDYLLRVSGRGHLDVADAKAMPYPKSRPVLESALLLRTLRLNCLTVAYADLWADLYDPYWIEDSWTSESSLPQRLEEIERTWNGSIPLRNEQARRAALVEIDALVAVMLGIDADQLIALYRSRFPQMLTYESAMWFDARGRKIAENFNSYGQGQTKQHYVQLVDHLDPEVNAPAPEGYEAPFYKADREGEYRRAHANFTKRLCETDRQVLSNADGVGGAA
ncbi:restriction endonuclease subunit M [Nocardia vinacea]|uniref:site-specific DNA-methyltransferase (adenine-specific) n=1 Tax=Nocardia vinacea TaxID=96468 RepID=A0ABZ1Z759_9NOCA|nr:restriction endonuclease subunit M [Nocardia vinacea]